MRAGMRNLPVKIYNKLKLGVEYVQFGQFHQNDRKMPIFRPLRANFLLEIGDFGANIILSTVVTRK